MDRRLTIYYHQSSFVSHCQSPSLPYPQVLIKISNIYTCVRKPNSSTITASTVFCTYICWPWSSGICPWRSSMFKCATPKLYIACGTCPMYINMASGRGEFYLGVFTFFFFSKVFDGWGSTRETKQDKEFVCNYVLDCSSQSLATSRNVADNEADEIMANAQTVWKEMPYFVDKHLITWSKILLSTFPCGR